MNAQQQQLNPTTQPPATPAPAASPSASREIYRTKSIVCGGVTLASWADVSIECNAAPMPLTQPNHLYPTDVLLGGPAGMIEHNLSIGGCEEIDQVYALAGETGAIEGTAP